MAKVATVAGRVVTSTCKSCKHFAFDEMTNMKHTTVGLGLCALDRCGYKFRPVEHTCARYDATAKRKAAIEALEKKANADSK
jgi:hypothetical protein